MIYLHRSVWNPGPLPENVEPSLSSAGSLPNDSSESNNSSSIRYVSFTNGRVKMNKSVQRTNSTISIHRICHSRFAKNSGTFRGEIERYGTIDNLEAAERVIRHLEHGVPKRCRVYGTERNI